MGTFSRQSAFRAIITLAVNTFVQEPGKILGQKYQSGRAIRTSPVVCIADSLLVIFEFVYLLSQGRSWRRSVTKIALLRGLRGPRKPLEISECPTGRCKAMEMTESPAQPVDESQPVHFELEARCFCQEAQPVKVRRAATLVRWWLRLVLFTVGALSQTIKIFASRGTLWVKLTATGYVLSFLVNELIVRFATEDDVDNYRGILSTPAQLHLRDESTLSDEGKNSLPDDGKNSLPDEGKKILLDEDKKIVCVHTAHRRLDDRFKNRIFNIIALAHILFPVLAIGTAQGWRAKIDLFDRIIVSMLALFLVKWFWTATGILITSFTSLEDQERSKMNRIFSPQRRQNVQDIIVRYPRWIRPVRIGVTLFICSTLLALVNIPVINRAILLLDTCGFIFMVELFGLRVVRSRSISGVKTSAVSAASLFCDIVVLWNLQMVIAYCAYACNPENSFKPRWTKYLG